MNGKLWLLSNQSDGRILALYSPDTFKPEGDGAPSGIQIVPLPGQVLHQLDASTDIAKFAPEEVMKRFRVKNGELVEVEERKNTSMD